ncbi:MCE family protein [bacterium]|nr:MCE family protein [bacterium]
MKDRVAVRVGVMSFLSILLLVGLLVWKSGVFLSLNGYELVGVFPSINGLIQGADVRYRGVKVGKVVAITPSPSHIEVRFWVQDGIQVPKGSIVKVFFDGLIGEKFLNIIPKSAEKTMLSEGGHLDGISSSGLAEFIELGADNLKSTHHILTHYDQLLTSQDVSNSLLNTIKAIEEMAISLSQTAHQLGMVSHRSGDDVSQMISQLLALSKTIRQSGDALVGDGQLVTQLRSMTGSMAASAQGIHTMVDRMNGVVTTDNAQRMNQVLLDVSSFTGTLSGASHWLSNSRVQGRVEAAPVSTVANGAHYMATLDWSGRQRFVRGGLMGATNQPGSLVAQLGVHVAPQWDVRAGYTQSKAGAGVDWKPHRAVALSLDLYDPEALKADLRGRWAISNATDVLVSLRRAATDQDYGVGLGVSFKLNEPVTLSQLSDVN